MRFYTVNAYVKLLTQYAAFITVCHQQEAAILMQLPRYHNYLEKYLFQKKLLDSDRCDCGQNQVKSRHLLL